MQSVVSIKLSNILSQQLLLLFIRCEHPHWDKIKVLFNIHQHARACDIQIIDCKTCSRSRMHFTLLQIPSETTDFFFFLCLAKVATLSVDGLSQSHDRILFPVLMIKFDTITWQVFYIQLQYHRRISIRFTSPVSRIVCHLNFENNKLIIY